MTVGFRGEPVAVPLDGLGLPGCVSHVDLTSIALTTLLPNTGNGELRWTLPIPATVSGLPIFLQGGVLAPTPYNALDLWLTNGACAFLGL